MNKYEQLIEHIINENEQAARELFHNIVVEKSRDIYESLMDEEMGGNPANQFVDNITQDVQGDEQGLGEEEEGDEELDLGDEGDDELDLGGDDEAADFGGDAEGEEEGSVEDRVMDLEDELDALKAEFDRLVGGEESGSGDMGGDDMGGDEFGADVEADDEEQDEGMMEAVGSGKSGSGKSGSGKSGSGKSSAEIMKEYVDKVKDFYKGDNAEGSEVAHGGSVAVNKGSTVAGKNDMGGSTANIAKGGSEQDPSGTSPKKANNYGTKGQGNLKGAGQFQNVPGANAKQEKTGKSYEKAHGKEGQTTDGSVPVSSTSPLRK